MHAPDGFLNAGTALATGTLSFGIVGMGLRQAKAQLEDKAIPLAGITAAFIFAAQMFNFPVAGGTTGHLIGGALAAILLGPSVGAIVLTIVVVVQAFAFADGGLTALGYNVLNMAIVPTYGGYAAFRMFRRMFPKTGSGVIGASGLAAWASVVMGAMAFSVEWLFGASAPIAFDQVFLAMVGVHLLIGIGEGVMTALTVGAVMSTRPDLVYGAADLDHGQMRDRRRVGTRAFVVGGLLVALVFAVGISQFTSGGPDGLESVAADTGFDTSAEDHALADGIFADYAMEGITNESLSLAIAGAVGVILILAVGAGVMLALRDRRPRDPAAV